jgi:hypothetical protein
LVLGRSVNCPYHIAADCTQDRTLGWMEEAIAFPYSALNRDRVVIGDRGEFDRFSCSWGGFWVVWSIGADQALKSSDRTNAGTKRLATVAVNFMVNLISGLMVYCHQPKKPAFHPEWALPPVRPLRRPARTGLVFRNVPCVRQLSCEYSREYHLRHWRSLPLIY